MIDGYGIVALLMFVEAIVETTAFKAVAGAVVFVIMIALFPRD